MPRLRRALTAIEIERLAKTPGRHAIGEGLYLFVGPRHAPGACSWAYRYMIAGRPRTMGLGSYPATRLSAVRATVVELQKLRLMGKDPLAEKCSTAAAIQLEEARATTFKQAAESYIEGHKASWQNAKHAAQWTSTLATYVYPIIGHLPVGEVDTGLVTKILEQPTASGTLWGTKPETAGRVRGRIEAILDSARVRGHREGENPARWRGHLDHVLPAQARIRKVKHHSAESIDGIPLLMAQLRTRDGSAASALDFLILTAGRTGEVLGATWEEFDLTAGLWTVPAERMKAKKEHRVPLSAGALAVLDRVRGPHASPVFSGVVFRSPGSAKPLSNMSLLSVLKRMDRKDLTVHGFRSTFRDWAAERTDFPTEAAELALAHAIDSKVEAAYRRGDQLERRREMMTAWADFCGVVPPNGVSI